VTQTLILCYDPSYLAYGKVLQKVNGTKEAGQPIKFDQRPDHSAHRLDISTTSRNDLDLNYASDPRHWIYQRQAAY